jgi:hypothetical protein
MSALPSTGEQARHALLLLGVPAPARVVVEAHIALFDGDLSMTDLAALMRDRAPGFCAALHPDLTAVRGFVALAEWSLERRIVTPAGRRADELVMVLRLAEFVAMRQFAGRAADRLLRQLAHRVPHGVEALDLAEAARAALGDPRLADQLAQEAPIREEAASRAAALEARQQLFGLPGVPRQRGDG